MEPFAVPTGFAERRLLTGGPDARSWLTSLPAVVDALCDQWGLVREPQRVLYGEFNLAIPVRRDGERLVLRIGAQRDVVLEEARGLRAWDGAGTVALLDVDDERGALLLERLDDSRTLQNLDITEAGERAGALIRRLAIDPRGEFRRLPDIASAFIDSVHERNAHLSHPIPRQWVDAAIGQARVLAPSTGVLMVHADLHYGNVLAGTREPWLAIDPRPVIGDPEYSTPELLWRSADKLADDLRIRNHLSGICHAGELDYERAKGWCLVRSVDYWLWALRNGLTEDPKRCARVLVAVSS
jgi:streptomycin 6-kinase